MCSFEEVIRAYGPTFTIAVAIGGWFVTSHQANQREKRKEFRSEIDAIEDGLESLLEKTGEYYRAQTRDLLAEMKIKVIFHSLDLRCERLFKRQKGGELGLFIDPVKKAKEDLFDLATGDYFETDTRMPEDERESFMLSLSYKAMSMIEALHTLHLKKFDGI